MAIDDVSYFYLVIKYPTKYIFQKSWEDVNGSPKNLKNYK